MNDEQRKHDKEVIELASEQFAEILVASIDEQASKPKNTEWTKEERDNVVGAFQILLEMDKKQHPENYKRNKKEEVK